MEGKGIGRAFPSSDHVFIPWHGANMSYNGGKMAPFSLQLQNWFTALIREELRGFLLTTQNQKKIGTVWKLQIKITAMILTCTNVEFLCRQYELRIFCVLSCEFNFFCKSTSFFALQGCRNSFFVISPWLQFLWKLFSFVFSLLELCRMLFCIVLLIHAFVLLTNTWICHHLEGSMRCSQISMNVCVSALPFHQFKWRFPRTPIQHHSIYHTCWLSTFPW